MKVYFVATMRSLENTSTRTVGYFKTQKDAIRCVEGNYGDIYEEGFYKYAIIECVSDGLYQYDLNPLFFEWNKEKQQYIRIERPEQFKNVIGFTIG